ncbi:MAG: alanine racemase [Sulfurovum sp. AS07-7]|nr:MAG: alanine racemase [Sulfurovum sp. AS07-7]
MAYIKINRSNLIHNLSQIVLKTGSVDKIAIVLKDNAYGHGVDKIAKIARNFGITKAVVRNYTEAKEIEELFDDVIVLGGNIIPSPKLSYAVNSIEKLELCPERTRIELKVDTGMHRNGIKPNELQIAIGMIKDKNINLVGVMSHFASADELGSGYFYQYKNFQNIKKIINECGFDNVRFHIHNSAGILRTKEFKEDLVRLGIGAYGYNPMDNAFEKVELKPVMSLYAKKVSSRMLLAGERVGYGGEFTAPKDMIVSTYDLGYGDGWRRGDVKQPYITPSGKEILGRVSMDFITLEGDEEEVCIMEDANIAAKHFGTISYEITCALHANIHRVIVD